MVFSYSSLANGQLPAAKGTLYTSVGETAVKQIVLVAAAAGAYTVNVYFKKSGGTSRRIIPPALPMDNADPDKAAQVDCLEWTMEMEDGDEIEGDCSSAASIDYVISGAVR